MALPGYWLSVNRKDLVERAIVDRRNYVANKAQKIESAARYHRDLNLLSSQYKNLEEQRAGISKVNQESRVIEEAKAKRRENLLERHTKLAKLLATENEAYFVELQALAELQEKKDPWNISKLKEQLAALRKKQEEDEEELRKRNSHRQQINVPYVKEYENELLGDAVKKAMEVKQKELEEEADQKLAQNKRRLQELQTFHQKAINDVETAKQEKEENCQKWDSIFKEQMKAIDENAEKANRMKLNKEQLVSLENLIGTLRKKREDIAKIHIETIKKIGEFRTFKDKIIRMSAEMRHNLELDLVDLNQLQQLANKQKDTVDVPLDICKVTEMLEIIKAMLEDENKHEVKFYALFEEEAAKLWKERKKVWDSEKWKNRDDLMASVFEDLLHQLKKHIRAYLMSEKDLVDSREVLLNHLIASRDKMQEEQQTFIDKEEYFQNKRLELAEKMKKYNPFVAEAPPKINHANSERYTR